MEKNTDQEKDIELDGKEQGKKEKPKKDKILKIPESEYNRLVDEAREYKDKHLRLFAEFDNARKRMDREKMEFVKYANEGLISEFLHIIDDLERSVNVAREKHLDYEAFSKGIEMIMKRVWEMLSKNGVKPIEAVGKKFDPHCHEVMMQEETPDHEEGTVIEEFQKGYYLGDKVVRTAKVKLAKAPQEEKKEENSNQ